MRYVKVFLLIPPHIERSKCTSEDFSDEKVSGIENKAFDRTFDSSTVKICE